ncbi:MAG: glycoside hydrolase family 20 zincin-like fold domain-containing protein, partial [Candidatus Gastranaerophilales bacterium]
MILRYLLLFVVAIFSVSLTATEIKLDMSAKRGLMIKLPHGNISSCSRMIAVEPPWVEKWFFNQSDDVTINAEQLENGEKFELIHGQDNGFKVIEYSAVRIGNSVKIIYQGKLTKDVPCALEYSAINVTDFFLAGASYSAILMDGTPKEGVLPEDETAKITYLTNVKSITFDSNYGTLNITVDKGIGLDVKNFRGSGFEDTLCYWIGVMDVPLKYGELFDSEITLEFIPNPNAVIPQPILSANAGQPTKVVENKTLVVDAETFDIGMIPALKKQELTQGTLTLGSAVDIDFNFKGDKVSVDRLRDAIDRVYDKLGGTAAEATKIVATVGEEAGELKAPTELDGYAMDITPTEISIVSRSYRGVFYAMQTLRSLVENGRIDAQK